MGWGARRKANSSPDPIHQPKLSSKMSIQIEPIAYLRTPWHEKFGVPRQPGLIKEAWGEVEFVADYAAPEAREGLQGFSHLWLTFLFDQVPEDQTRLRVRPPRLGGNEKLGVFATRSPFRPNRIGLSVCEIETVFPTLRVKGVDIVDGTAVLDVRPYLPYVDALPEATAGFAPGPPVRIPVAVAPELQERWAQLSQQEQKLIREMISLQPGPAYQQGEARTYHARVAGHEVAWQVTAEGGSIVAIG
jgi:tRNA-Thr(GGU) m(6)t(6)A37 methyltransferase TsaA